MIARPDPVPTCTVLDPYGNGLTRCGDVAAADTDDGPRCEDHLIKGDYRGLVRRYAPAAPAPAEPAAPAPQSPGPRLEPAALDALWRRHRDIYLDDLSDAAIDGAFSGCAIEAFALGALEVVAEIERARDELRAEADRLESEAFRTRAHAATLGLVLARCAKGKG